MVFKRVIENFTCAHCGTNVTGNGYTNHCPHCLWSMHIDIAPGDRSADCHGLLRPISASFKQDQYTIVHRCERCGVLKKNKASTSDNTKLLIELTSQPL